jgi:hypothetical protein
MKTEVISCSGTLMTTHNAAQHVITQMNKYILFKFSTDEVEVLSYFPSSLYLSLCDTSFYSMDEGKDPHALLLLL